MVNKFFQLQSTSKDQRKDFPLKKKLNILDTWIERTLYVYVSRMKIVPLTTNNLFT